MEESGYAHITKKEDKRLFCIKLHMRIYLNNAKNYSAPHLNELTCGWPTLRF